MTDREFIESLAHEAGHIQLARLRSALTVERKGAETDLVTAVDRAIDQLIVSVLRQRFPAHAIVSEEGMPSPLPLSQSGRGVAEGRGEGVWYVDPLDGTTNYAHAYPVFAVSIGLWRGEEMALGVVYDASRDELFSGEHGAGAFLNGKRLRVSATAALGDALVSTGFPYDRATNPDNNFTQFANVTRQAQSVRRAGAAAIDLAHIAAGRLDGHWERGLGPWDCAAGSLLVIEAGGRLSALRNGPWSPTSTWTVATNGLIHDELLDALA